MNQKYDALASNSPARNIGPAREEGVNFSGAKGVPFPVFITRAEKHNSNWRKHFHDKRTQCFVLLAMVGSDILHTDGRFKGTAFCCVTHIMRETTIITIL